MKPLSRRKFITRTASAGGVMLIAPYLSGCLSSQNKMKKSGYFEAEFGIDEKLCRKLLETALSKGGDFADLYFEHTISNFLILEDGKVNQSYGDIDLGVGIRTVKDDQVGYGFTQELTEDSMLSAARTAASLVNASAIPVKEQFSTPEIGDYYPVSTFLNEFPLSSKLPVMQGINEKCFELSDLIRKVSVVFQDEMKRIMVVTSDGVMVEDLIPGNFCAASVIAEKDGKMESGGWEYGGHRDFSWYDLNLIEKLSNQAVDRTLIKFDAIQPPAGEMPVVLGSGITGVLLHEAIGHGMEADFNRKNISIYSTMIGKKVAEPFVTIIDDGTIPNLSGSINVDDEGTPGKKTVLVENGILTGYLHDKISAHYYNVEPTGNGRRQNYQYMPFPRMRNTYMMNGDATPDDVIKQVKNGIYVQDVSNGEVFIGQGDFSFYVSQGYQIENGKLTAPIKDINIMGNGPKMLENITMAANDLTMYQGGAGMCGKENQGVKVSFGLPTCLVKSMTVGGTSQRGGVS
jgi:TldD protein